MKIIKLGLIKIIELYQFLVSPLFGVNCRFEPTCSRYAIESIRKYNIFYAILKIIWRILKCNPFCGGGHDPVSKVCKK